MERPRLLFEKEVIARLQDEEMNRIMGASSHGNTSSSKGDDSSESSDDKQEPTETSKSCCQKSCNGDK